MRIEMCHIPIKLSVSLDIDRTHSAYRLKNLFTSSAKSLASHICNGSALLLFIGGKIFIAGRYLKRVSYLGISSSGCPILTASFTALSGHLEPQFAQRGDRGDGYPMLEV